MVIEADIEKNDSNLEKGTNQAELEAELSKKDSEQALIVMKVEEH